MLFVTFFPQLIAGPIVLHDEMIPQFRDITKKKMDSDSLAQGIYIFSIGLFKKVIIADTFGRAVAWGYADTTMNITSMEMLIVSLSYTFQIYFDFSGYCDMALGISQMFNMTLPVNFNSPYQAISIIDFWKRWHMSLTRFLTNYIYIPLGGNRKGKIRTYINIMVVFLVSGIWHGANWTFIAWGLLHGFFNCLNRLFNDAWNRLHVVMQWLITFVLVNFLWIFFRASSVKVALSKIKTIVSLQDLSMRDDLFQCFNLAELIEIEKRSNFMESLSYHISGINMWIFLGMALVIVLNMKNCNERKMKISIGSMIGTIVILVWSIMALSGISTFLYFNF